MKRLISCLLFLGIFMLPSSTFASDTKEWILYFNNEKDASSFKNQYDSSIIDQYSTMLRGTFSQEKINALVKANQIQTAEPNIQKAAAIQSSTDPLFSQQWGHTNIQFQRVLDQYPTTRKNILEGKQIHTPIHSFPYQYEQINTTSFSIDLNKEPVRRLSIELAKEVGNWDVTITDEQHHVITQHSTTRKKIDLLLPKNQTYSTIKIDIQAEKQPITIKKMLATNSVIVAVVDSGVTDHEDFCDNILYSLGKDYREGLTFPQDRFGHGTHVTGIIAACANNQVGISGVVGMAPVDILPLKVLDQNGNGGDFELSKAIADAANLNVDVINLSLAGKGHTIMLEQSIMQALQKGVPVVAAAGNWNISTENVYPASFPGVITVSSVNQANKKVKSSDYGWEVDISAPGFEIISTYTKPSYKTMTGTSMAAPYVSGAIALLKEDNRNLDLIEIRQLLAQSTLDLGSPGFDKTFGFGLLQIPFQKKKPSHQLEWLTLRNNQPLNQDKPHSIGFSKELMGNKLIVFAEETFLLEKSIQNRIEPLPFQSFTSSNNRIPLTALVVNGQNKIIDSVSISAINQQSSNSVRSFKDVPKDFWAYSEITTASKVGIINGYSDDTFQPSNPISRRHSIMMLNRLLELETPSTLTIPFDDVTLSTTGIMSILSGYEKGLINQTSKSFHPENKLTRGQMALLLARALNINKPLTKPSYSFKDVPTDAEIYNAVQQLATRGIITKQPYFKPNEPINRAQFATMLMRAKTGA